VKEGFSVKGSFGLSKMSPDEKRKGGAEHSHLREKQTKQHRAEGFKGA
jgi:hypothetical protein